MNEWLDNLNVGDKVVIRGGGVTDRWFCSTVARLTKTLIFITANMKFRRRDGRSPSEWATGCLLEPTPENLERVEQENLKISQMRAALQLQQYAWHELPLETLEKIKKLLPKST